MPPRIKRTLLAALATLLLGLGAWATDEAAGATLHVGSSGPRVAALKWMETGHRPSVYRGIRCKLGAPRGYYGKTTARCVRRTKYRLGFPLRVVNGRAGADLFEILKGDRARPRAYVSRARARARAAAGQPAWAAKLIRIERHELKLGVHEIPAGSNWAPRIAMYQLVTGALHAAWCASLQQWARMQAGYGTIANRSAGVFYIVDWSRRHGLSRSKPRPGYLVAFLDHLGHIGLVQKVTRGGFWTIEGNASDRVLERFHPYPATLRPVEFIAAGPHAG